MPSECICIPVKWNVVRSQRAWTHCTAPRPEPWPSPTSWSDRWICCWCRCWTFWAHRQRCLQTSEGAVFMGQCADTGSDGGFAVCFGGYMYGGSVFVYLCQSHESSIVALNLKEETSSVCLRGCKYSQSRMLLFTHILKALCAVTQEFLPTSLSLFLTGFPESQGVGWYRFVPISRYYWKNECEHKAFPQSLWQITQVQLQRISISCPTA